MTVGFPPRHHFRSWQLFHLSMRHRLARRKPPEHTRAASDAWSHEFFLTNLKASGVDREDIGTWFELLDLDDYLTFGGKA